MMQPASSKMMSYQNSPTTTTTTLSSRSSKSMGMLVIVAGMLLLLLVVMGGTVGRRPEVGSSSMTAAAEGRVVATPLSAATEDYDYDYGTTCVPASRGATFGGVSTTPEFDALGPEAPFETCFQFGNEATYCWTQSYYNNDDRFYPCYPTSRHGYPYYPNPRGGQWNSIDQDDMPSVHPVTHPYSCGRPCQDQHIRPDSF